MAPPRDWKANNRHLQVLRNAEEGHYGVLAAIAYNIEQITAFVQAAQLARSPFIIQFFPWAVTFADGLLVRAASKAIQRCDVPISIHLDHAQDVSVIKLAAETLPFDSIMVDMSHYEMKENLAKTAELVKYCHERGIATEAEPGRITGAEDGVMDTATLEGSKTTMEDARNFVGTGVDCLAPAIGNVHGEYDENGPQLDFDRLSKLRAYTDGKVQVALHGTNGFKPELMRGCIAAGVAKINVNRLVLDNYYIHLEANVGKLPHTALIEGGVKEVIAQTMEWMEICGSKGKA